MHGPKVNGQHSARPHRGMGQLGLNIIRVSAIVFVFVEGLGAESVGASQGLQ